MRYLQAAAEEAEVVDLVASRVAILMSCAGLNVGGCGSRCTLCIGWESGVLKWESRD